MEMAGCLSWSCYSVPYNLHKNEWKWLAVSFDHAIHFLTINSVCILYSVGGHRTHSDSVSVQQTKTTIAVRQSPLKIKVGMLQYYAKLDNYP